MMSCGGDDDDDAEESVEIDGVGDVDDDQE
jgi:hypothetical protein